MSLVRSSTKLIAVLGSGFSKSPLVDAMPIPPEHVGGYRLFRFTWSFCEAKLWLFDAESSATGQVDFAKPLRRLPLLTAIFAMILFVLFLFRHGFLQTGRGFHMIETRRHQRPQQLTT